MLAALLMVTLAVSTTEVWTTSTLNPMTGDSRLYPTASDGAHLYAARGEHEGILVFVRAGRRGLDQVTVETPAPGDAFPPPQAWRVGTVALKEKNARTLYDGPVPDPLAPPAPIDVPSGGEVVFYVEYAVPYEATPGTYETRIDVVSNDPRTRSVDVRLDVFAFPLPMVPSLAGFAPLDRKAINNTYGLENRDIGGWIPIYEALAPWRLSYPVWAGGDLVSIAPDESIDATAFQQHLAYANARGPMAAIDIGGAGRGMALFPPPLPGFPTDPLADYLAGMMGWLRTEGLAERAVMEVMRIDDRDFWQPARADYFRVWRAERTVPRLLHLPLHPYWGHYTDLWAAPFLAYGPDVPQGLTNGQSLRLYPDRPGDVDASSSGMDASVDLATHPADAFDGAPVSAWFPAKAPSTSEPQWVEKRFREAFTVTHITLLWAGETIADPIDVKTAYQGDQFITTSISWDHQRFSGPYAHSISYGTLKFEKRIQGIHLTLRGTVGKGVPGLAEVVFAGTLESDAVETMPRVTPWLAVRGDHFPAVGPGAHPAEMRLLPWVCHAHKLQGFYLTGLTGWPGVWRDFDVSSADAWPAAVQPELALFYPGAGVPMPSLRAVHLRDGLDDYDYLTAWRQAMESGRIDPGNSLAALGTQPFGSMPTPEELDRMGTAVEANRLRIGRMLSEEFLARTAHSGHPAEATEGANADTPVAGKEGGLETPASPEGENGAVETPSIDPSTTPPILIPVTPTPE